MSVEIFIIVILFLLIILCDLRKTNKRLLNKINSLKSDIDLLQKQLQFEIDKENIPCSKALDSIWKEVILKRYPNYGDWEYAAQAARHIIAEFKEPKK